MSCTAFIETTLVGQKLREVTSDNSTLFTAYKSAISTDSGYTQDFTDELKQVTGIDINNVPDNKVNEVVDFIKKYYNKHWFDVNLTAKNKNTSDDVARYGYNSVADRDFCIHVCANYICDCYNQLAHSNKDDDLKDKNIDYFISYASWKIEKLLTNRLSELTNLDEESILDIIDSGDIVRLEELFGNNPTIPNANLLALYKEISLIKEDEEYNKEFFDRVFDDSRLAVVRALDRRNNQESEVVEQEMIEAGDTDSSTEDSTDTGKDIEDSKNAMAIHWNDNGGMGKDYRAGIDAGILTYLGSLKKIISRDDEGNYYYDLDNALGVPDVMDANSCCAILYGKAEFTNLDTFIDSIKVIANGCPGFAAFHQLIDDCKKDKDLLFKLYTNFGRNSILKLETQVTDEGATTTIVNPNSDSLTSLRFEYINSVKFTGIRIDEQNATVLKDSIDKKIKEVETLNTRIKDGEEKHIFSQKDIDSYKAKRSILIKELKSELFNQLVRYYPTINEAGLANYVENANDGKVLDNLSKLTSILADTIKGSVNTSIAYENREAEIRRIYARRKAAKNDTTSGKTDIEELNSELDNANAEEYLSNASIKAAVALADELIKYVVPKNELNSRNVHGNQSSNVMNNCMLTNIINTLKSPEALNNFGKYRFRTRQYDFSNIMLEHWEYERDEQGNYKKDEKGNFITTTDQPINYGLFVRNPETGELTPTKYATELLKVRLFNGATDTITDNKALYKEMSPGDYVATGFVNFFNAEDTIATDTDKSIQFANYFMRIPSDAPKNFIIRAPKYNTRESKLFANDGLIQIKDLESAKKAVRGWIRKLPVVNQLDFYEKYSVHENKNEKAKEKYAASNREQLVERATSEDLDNIRIYPNQINEKGAKKGDTITVTYDYLTEGVHNIYVMQGTLGEDNGVMMLQNPKFLGSEDGSYSSDVINDLEKIALDRLIKDGTIQQQINTNHQVFKQFRQIFIQELTDASTALDLFFERENGLVKRDAEGNPMFKPGYANDEATARKLYEIYHVGKGKTIFETKNGKQVLTGKVFTSDRFTITTEDANGNVTIRNYGEELLENEEIFSFLYGGGRNTYIHTNANGEVILTEAQEAALNEKLQEFIIDYVNNTKERMESYRDFVPSEQFTDNNIVEFAINHHIAYVGFNDLFEGDTKYYKDSQIFLKRAKESQASGIPYGIVNYNMDLSESPTHIDSNLDNIVFKAIDKNGNSTDVQYELRSKFKAVTIANTVRTNSDTDVEGVKGAEKDGPLTIQLAQAIHNAGIDEKTALERARDMMAGSQRDGKHGFHSVTVNDAQSYITFEEWVRRITARGQLRKYQPLIEAILDESKPIDNELIDEFVQVQKNFYYDIHVNDRLHTAAPRQIKNAEFVLVPRFIRGTQLEQVHELMVKHHIDQLNTAETSKAGKAYTLTLWNENEELTNDNIKDFDENADNAAEYYNYNYLYTQQETPQHINSNNKAGIQFVKKIIDNIDESSPLYKHKEAFFKLYCANIKESSIDLLDELSIEHDKDGNIILVGDNEHVKGLDYETLYTMFKEEVQRQGLDSNMLDYVTLSEDSPLNSDNGLSPTTNMPNYMSLVAPKMESVAQSIFNSRVTRQLLPGFHAAQITGVGFSARTDTVTYKIAPKHAKKTINGEPAKATLTEEEYKNLSTTEQKYYIRQKGNVATSRTLRYHPNGERYIEVMVPANNFGLQKTRPDGTLKSDEELLEELQKEGLDTFIGYRIPTEGKQSMCVMKVVGFTDDSLGSTIVVPDDWVSQTGSDFDIDSVYGIQFKGRVNKRTGKIERIKYVTNPTIYDYFRFVARKLDHKRAHKTADKVRELKKDFEKREETFTKAFDESGELYHALPEEIRNVIKELQKDTKEYADNEKQQRYIDQLNNVNAGLKEYLSNNEVSDEVKAQVESYITSNEQILDAMSITKVTTQLKELGVISYEEFLALSTEEQNSKDARNNELLLHLIDILSDEKSLEENLSRSNFEKVIAARDKFMNKNIKDKREARSPFNFLDQAEYQDDVMSGAKLKAFSVTRDNFCSVCNTVKPTISEQHQITVVYRAKDGYSLEELKKSFDNVKVIDEENGIYSVTHNTIGWTKNNRNTVGMLLTSYSSQTTAHILDSVKEGPVPNVNDMTFQVYKLFPDIGSDYETGISFMMQNGVTTIVEEYNKGKSIYSKNYSKPINSAIKRIARQILELKGDKSINQFTPMDEVLAKLHAYSSELGRLFGANRANYKISLDDAETAKLLISASRNAERINKTGVFAGNSEQAQLNRLLYDLGVVLQYNKLSHLADAISRYARVSNPDKFGAKQTVFATGDIFNQIQDITADDIENPILKAKDKEGRDCSFLQAVYPGVHPTMTVEEFLKSDNADKSVYPSLYAFLKYATATSIKVNRQLFITENENFVSKIKELEQDFSGNRTRIDENTYKDFKNYVLNEIYNSTNAVRFFAIYEPGNGFIFDETSSLDKERARIYGYGKSPDLKVPIVTIDNTVKGRKFAKYKVSDEFEEFKVKDITNPTDIEIYQFSMLSPAQKVSWMQAHAYNAGVFNRYKVNLVNGRNSGNRAGSQTIQFIEDNVNFETVYEEFKQCFYNDNPLVAMTALDIVKYAFAVEGFRMRRNGVSKSISNRVLIDGVENDGTGIVQNIVEEISKLLNPARDISNTRHNYIRSHSTTSKISTYKVDKINKIPDLPRIGDNIIYLDIANNENHKRLANKYGFTYEIGTKGNFGYNRYVKLRFDKKTVLYKIVPDNEIAPTKFAAYPVNLLEANENSKWSVNPTNNTYLAEEYYLGAINEVFTANTHDDRKAVIEKHKADREKYKYENPYRKTQDYALDFDINEKGTINTGGFEDVIAKVGTFFSENPTGRLYVRSIALDNFIKKVGQSSIQTINGKEYLIKKVDFRNYNDYYIGHHSPNFNVDALDKQIKDIMEKANTSVTNAFMIQPYTASTTASTTRRSSITEERRNPVTQLGVNAVNSINRAVGSENLNIREAAKQAKVIFDDNKIDNTTESVKANTAEIIATTAQYVHQGVNSIMNDLQYFYESEDGIWHSVNDSATINHIRNNPAEQQRFLQVLLDARAFVKNFNIVNVVDLTSEDAELAKLLKSIQEDINRLETSTLVNQAEDRYAEEYLGKISKNPLIESGQLSILDGYKTTGAFEAYINDLQETSNPLLQVVTSEVMGDIRAAEMRAKDYIRELRKKIAKIKEDAKAAGEEINWDNIIDEYGRFTQDYSPEFVEQINTLRDNMNRYKFDPAYGEGSYEYLKAKLEYDKFKLNHINQPLIDDYYHAKIEIEEDMLNNHRAIYVAYKKLDARRKTILSYIRQGALEESLQQEYNKIKKEMDNLSSDYYYDAASNSLNKKYDYNDPNNPFTGEQRELYSAVPAKALANYIKQMKALNGEYYTYDAKFGFEEELAKNLRIVANAERRTETGKLTVPMSQLMDNEEYVEAKTWLEFNARYVVTPEVFELVNKAFDALREAQQGRRLLSNIAKTRNLYDNRGVINATLLTDEDIDKLREEELKDYNIREGQPYSDRSLISNAPEDDTVFNISFYTGMKSNGISNPEYIKLVNEINDILRPHYDPITKQLLTHELTEEELEKLIPLYDKIEDTKAHINATNGKRVYKYMERNVDFLINQEAFEREKHYIDNSPNVTPKQRRLWYELNERLEEDKDGNTVVVPNRRMYGYMVPKGYKPDGSGNNSKVDPEKTKALRIIKEYTRTDVTEYYYKKYEEMRAKGEAAFREWYNKNHIYNPYTHEVQPLKCWTTMVYVQRADDGDYKIAGTWVPAHAQRRSRPKDGRLIPGPNGSMIREDKYTNDNYKPNTTLEGNYKRDGIAFTKDYLDGLNTVFGQRDSYADGKDYSNSKKLNHSEQAMKELFRDTLRQMAKTKSVKAFFDQGYMAARHKGQETDAKFIAKELAKLVGWIDTKGGREQFLDDSDVDYATDKTIDMPLMSLLKSKDSVKVNYKRPTRKDNESDAEYQQRVKQWEDDKKASEEKNKEIHKNLLDRNFENVLEDFVNKAFRFNAVQDNRYKLFYAKNMIDKLEVYTQRLGQSNLRRADGKYVTKRDTLLQQQYINWIRRLVYNQWKEPNGMYTRAANILQSLTSAKFMMLNVSGGVANVTVGHVQILAEILGRENFGRKTWAKAIAMYNRGIPDYLANMNKETSSSLSGAIIKFMNVVDFDELNGVVNVPDAKERIKRIRDYAFSPNAMGEHLMQNGAMFALMHENRIYRNEDKDKNGRLTYTFKNKAEAIRDSHEKALLEIISNDETLKARWQKFKDYQTSDANRFKDYALFRRNLVTDFVDLYMSNRKAEFNKIKQKFEKEATEEFETHPTIIDQLQLDDDGMLGFKDGSIFKEMGDEAYQLLGRFKGRVISVNKKIHGNYDKLAAAQLEKHWWGGLVMQYHKHIYPGIVKRYRRKGYFNEERGTIEKGAVWALKNFLAMPFHKRKFIEQLKADGITDAELEVQEGIQNLFKSYVDFFLHIRLNYQSLPENEKANIRRLYADFLGTMSALCLAVALCAMGDDDDFGFNFMMNQADRLASESAMYNPFGLYLEGKKLWSSPIAAQSFIGDSINTMGLISQYLLQGDDFDPYYSSGLYAGENKVWVKIARNIPMWHSINMLKRLDKNNKYYKLGTNILGVVPADKIAEWITD